MWKLFTRKPKTASPDDSSAFLGFEYPAKELSAFGTVENKFIISLKNERVVYHTPEDAQAFYTWLIENM